MDLDEHCLTEESSPPLLFSALRRRESGKFHPPKIPQKSLYEWQLPQKIGKKSELNLYYLDYYSTLFTRVGAGDFSGESAEQPPLVPSEKAPNLPKQQP